MYLRLFLPKAKMIWAAAALAKKSPQSTTRHSSDESQSLEDLASEILTAAQCDRSAMID